MLNVNAYNACGYLVFIQDKINADQTAPTVICFSSTVQNKHGSVETLEANWYSSKNPQEVLVKWIHKLTGVTVRISSFLYTNQ